MPPMPPPVPGTGPENSDAHAIRTFTGRVRGSIFETSPERLLSSESLSVVGACRYLTRSPTSSDRGMQMIGNIQGFDFTKSFCQTSFEPTTKTHSQAITAIVPTSDTMTTWTYGVTPNSGSGFPNAVSAPLDALPGAASTGAPGVSSTL